MSYHVSQTMDVIKALSCKAIPHWKFNTVKYVYQVSQTYYNMLHHENAILRMSQMSILYV